MLGTSAAGRNSVYCRCRSSVVIAISPRPCYIGGVSTAIPHIYAIGIEPADIDFMGHVNNANYLKWVQAAVIDHWQRLAPAEAVAGHLWVALKHEITYRKPAFLDDDVLPPPPPAIRRRNPARVTCRYSGAYGRHFDPKRANCWWMTLISAGSAPISAAKMSIARSIAAVASGRPAPR